MPDPTSPPTLERPAPPGDSPGGVLAPGPDGPGGSQPVAEPLGSSVLLERATGPAAIFRRTWPLLLGVGLLATGLGLQQSVLGLRATEEGFSTSAIGLMMSGFYIGYLAASRWVPGTIGRVGHIRTFAALAAAAGAILISYVLLVHPGAWVPLRLLNGMCVAGLFVVAESWLNGQATNLDRGSILAGYMVVVLGGLAAGQLLLNLPAQTGFERFALASVLTSAAVIPVALSRQRPTQAPEPERVTTRELLSVAPLAIVTAAAVGLAQGALLTLGVVYGRLAGLGIAEVSLLMAATSLGAMLFQVPFGRISDRIDRRLVMGVAALGAGAVAGVAALLRLPTEAPVLVGLFAVHGGLSFPLYSLALAHLQDHVDDARRVGANVRVVLVQGAGAAVGPIVGSAALTAGPAAFAWYLAAVYGAAGSYALYRTLRQVRAAVQRPYEPIVSGATPSIVVLAADASIDDPVEDQGHLPVGPADIFWRRVGEGPPVVLVHAPGSSSQAWHHQLAGLATAGFAPVAYDLRGHGRSSAPGWYRLDDHVDDLRNLLEQVAGTPAHVVAQGASAAIAFEVASRYPEQVGRLALISPPAPGGKWAPSSWWDRQRRRVLARLLSHRLTRHLVARRVADIMCDRRRNPDGHDLIAEDLLRVHPQALHETSKATRAARRHWATPGVPVLVIRGGIDGTRDPRRRVGRSDLEVVAAGAGPFVGLERPEGLDRVLAQFFSRAPAGDRSEPPPVAAG